jgi:UDP-N-acetyl-D-mannosaminuronic acid dehydrogenase
MRGAVKVAVVGLGYVGVPLAAAVAATRATVVGVDIDSEKVESVNAGRSPLRGREPGVQELLEQQVSEGRLRATLDPADAAGADVVAICVETPIEPSTHDPSHKALKAALSAIGPYLKRGALVTIESTLAPRTMQTVVRPALERASKMKVGRDIHLVHCPERLTTGKLLHHLKELPRVLGANEPVGLRKGLAFYQRFVNAEVHPTDWTTAEVVKTAENAYWDVQIAFANEVGLISEELGVDAYRVRELVNTCPYRLMLVPGAGVGGHCIPKDPWLLIAPALQTKPELIPTARAVNDFMPRRMARLVEEALSAAGRRVKGARVAILGFSYRENTDDTRNTPALEVVRELRRRGAEVTIHDPFARTERGYTILRDLKTAAKDADCLALVTAHDAYRKLDLKSLRKIMRRHVIVDGRNVFDGLEVIKAGFIYRGIGKGQF